MKKKTLLTILSVLFVNSVAVMAQTIKDEIAIIQGLYGVEKRQLVDQTLALSETDATRFWPVYDAYEEQRKKLGAERIMIIADYVNNYNNLTDAKANELAERLFKSDIAFDKLHQSYYSKFKKALSPTKAAQFMQIESYLQNIIRVNAQNELPFIQSLN